jgi:hypothetical protein
MKRFPTWKNWQNTPWTLVSKHQKDLAIFPILHQNNILETLVIEADTDGLVQNLILEFTCPWH